MDFDYWKCQKNNDEDDDYIIEGEYENTQSQLFRCIDIRR